LLLLLFCVIFYFLLLLLDDDQERISTNKTMIESILNYIIFKILNLYKK
jgi:hypothetical protein